jgi:type I restriction enzyme R subunit
VSGQRSLNFAFLAVHDAKLVEVAGQAERLFAEHPNATLMMLRLFGELLAQHVAAAAGVFAQVDENQATLLGRLRAAGALSPEIADLFHTIRKAGNAASHQAQGDHRSALTLLRMARELGIWFHRAAGAPKSFAPGPFVPPPDPRGETRALADELARLRKELADAEGAKEAARKLAEHEAELREQAEARAQRATEERAQWEELAQLTEADRATAETALRALQQQRLSAPFDTQKFLSRAELATKKVVLDEHQTRLIIDQQLRDAGWDADTENLTHAAGSRPEPQRKLAIAEWPTKKGPADYVLFVGLTAVGVVEAKRKTVDVAGAIEQSKRYARALEGVQLAEGAPWAGYKVPFLYSTNGRPYLRQLDTKSGVQFLDARDRTHHTRALSAWHSPDALWDMLGQDVERADEQLAHEPTDYLDLRPYQLDTIRKVEQALARGQRAMLVAMATGTGKTKTCIGLLYRLLKVKRFRRVLFLVDRSALGEQTENAFHEMRFEQHQLFTDIFDVKGLGDLTPDPDTRLHIATVQSLVKRVLMSDECALSVGAYDCIVVDECHRGYLLDRELSDDELTFRDENDYISKYRRVLDHFDAVKIGLTATPALHTVEIFGGPIATYSYRNAVVDGYLIDHEPPIAIKTELGEDGIHWQAGEELVEVDGDTGEVVDKTILPDEVTLEIESFNRRVITENFNRVVCERLAQHIDPNLREKTIVFCVNDQHADMVVKLLKEAFDQVYGAIDDDLVQKITGKADKPAQRIRTFKNEHAPTVAVTVDLLTTGIDVPAVCNIVFLRRVKSRILYDQLLGRATRRCDDIGKTVFRVFDAVDLYAALSSVSDMKPVVVDPKLSFAHLLSDLAKSPEPSRTELLLDQFLVKLRAKGRRMSEESLERFRELTGSDPKTFADTLRQEEPDAARARLGTLPKLSDLLDRKTGPAAAYVLSTHADSFRGETRGYGLAERPEDYLDAFARFVRENMNKLPALVAVTQRPRELTRAELRELRMALEEAQFRESWLQTAWRDKSNADIAATIIGFVRKAALGDPLVPYEERVSRALHRILSSRPWTAPQRKWLERIGKAMKRDVVVDRTTLDEGQFREDSGGFQRLDKQFGGKLEEILGDLREAVWKEPA